MSRACPPPNAKGAPNASPEASGAIQLVPLAPFSIAPRSRTMHIVVENGAG